MTQRPSVEPPAARTPLSPPPPPPEVARQLAAPPAAPVPEQPADPLPPSGAPPTPAYVRENLGVLEARLTSRCGRMVLRLGDQLRKDRQEPEGHAVLLLEAEPREGAFKIRGSTIQSMGAMRQSAVACAQLHLRGLDLPVAHLQPGARFGVQVVLGLAAP